MQNLVAALTFLLETALAVAGVDLTLTAAAQPPSGSTELGSAPALVLPIRCLKISRGSGPSERIYWIGHWTLLV